jgi:hypothetical protein
VLWSTIATAPAWRRTASPASSRTDGQGGRLFASSDRRLPALWNLVDSRGGSVGVVGWWNTWPAEHVDGYIVSDRFAQSLYQRNFGGGDWKGICFPAELEAELSRSRGRRTRCRASASRRWASSPTTSGPRCRAATPACRS